MIRKMIAIMLAFAFAIIAPSSARAAGEDAEYMESVRSAVEEICLSMTKFMERPDKIKAIKLENTPDINAYADNKGHITFLMGMVDFVRSEDEIAAVCGHELAHLSAQHLKRSIGTSILSTVVSTAIGGTAGDLTGALIQNKQSRKHERESDQRGLMYMWQAGYDPRAIWKFWASLESMAKGGSLKIEKYFSTHPVTNERVENLKVHIVRVCKTDPTVRHCDDILKDQDLLATYDQFSSRE